MKILGRNKNESSMKFRELFIFANFEVPDSDQKICDKNDKEYCHTEMKTTKKKICSRIFNPHLFIIHAIYWLSGEILSYISKHILNQKIVGLPVFLSNSLSVSQSVFLLVGLLVSSIFPQSVCLSACLCRTLA